MPCLNVDREKRRVAFDLSKQDELTGFYERFLSDDLEHVAIDPEEAPEFYGFLDILEKSPPPDLKIVHLGLLGPITFGLATKDQQTEKPALYDVNMRDVIIKTQVMKAKWQEKKIKDILPGVATMVTVGEPSLGIIDTPFGSISTDEVVEIFDELFRDLGSMGCVHCCDNMDWGKLMKTRTRIINPDAYESEGSESISRSRRHVRLGDRSCRFGITDPTGRQQPDGSAGSRIGPNGKSGNRQDVPPGALVYNACLFHIEPLAEGRGKGLSPDRRDLADHEKAVLRRRAADILSSFNNTLKISLCEISCRARARTITVAGWLPVFPPVSATIGIYKARISKCVNVVSKL
jgi:hypothetical protein